jgi:hypothetical protein
MEPVFCGRHSFGWPSFYVVAFFRRTCCNTSSIAGRAGSYHLTQMDGLLAQQMFNWGSFFTLREILLIVVGEFLDSLHKDLI